MPNNNRKACYLLCRLVRMEGVFVFQDENHSEFTFHLYEFKDIQHARQLINSETTERPHVTGTIVMGTSILNPALKFHMDPNSIQFVDSVNKTCDVSIKYLNDHTIKRCDDVLKDCHWCNGGNKVIKEVQTMNSQRFIPRT
ncbi:hypothetical protein PPL_07012 [Heterostelium album PN500]|uniref:BP74 N-terminal domain-containing protein n=1 Tax=Heterostelium pallidum (strain ATCC 26659 / Pp 5 / PN500) TaxID=670386 RepID=D3BE59_HETP5|nr:hypothetical protein PPL_07012 [Heterostelium album PN500]EFA80190.1 hypothetical protein PPL_07012 [Heterostelium album PN500]|eukprot:XP_020432310.1 hypothetical protein PPL_07012 [Heterostelium album PN500]